MGSPFDLGAAGISAGASVANTALTNKTNREIADANNRTSIQIANDNNQMQRDLNSENNQFSHDEAQLAFDRQVEQWERENAYNAPIEQLKRFQEAGINPTLGLLGNSAMPAANATTSPMASPHGSGITPSMPQLQQAVMNPFDIGESLMKSVTAIANAKKAGIETKTMEQVLDSVVSKAKSDARFSEIQGDLAEIQDYLQTRYGEARFNAETQEILERTFEHSQNAIKAQRDGELSIARKEESLANAAVLRLDKKLKKKELNAFDDRLSATLDNIKADTQDKQSRARNTDYQTDFVLPEEVNKLAAEAKTNKNLAGVYAVQLVSEWEEYNNTKLTPEQRKLLRQKVTSELKSFVGDTSTAWYNPFQAIATLISPLARQIGIALGAGSNFNITKKPK